MEKPSKKLLQKQILAAAKRGERILDLLVEYQRIYKLDPEETKRLASKTIKDKMFQQEKIYKTVVTKRTRHLVAKKTQKKDFSLDTDD